MAKTYELSLHPDSVPDWGVWEAVREFIQNWRDNDNPSRWSYSFGKLCLVNRSTSLSPSVLLSGYSSKRGDNNSVGCHGDGFKSALAVLIREGINPVIFNSGVVWNPHVDYSDEYDSEIIKVAETGDCREYTGELEICIPISESQMEEVYRNYLGFTPHAENEVKETSKGTILLNENHKGRIYCGGIYVNTFPDLDYGYDFKPEYLQLDRDRKQVSSFDIKWITKDMWSEVSKERDDMSDAIAHCLYKGTPDMEYLGYVNNTHLQQSCVKLYEKELDGWTLVDTPEEVPKQQAAGNNKAIYLGNDAFTNIVKSSREYKAVELDTSRLSPVEILEEFLDTWHNEMTPEMESEYKDMLDKIQAII